MLQKRSKFELNQIKIPEEATSEFVKAAGLIECNKTTLFQIVFALHKIFEQKVDEMNLVMSNFLDGNEEVMEDYIFNNQNDLISFVIMLSE